MPNDTVHAVHVLIACYSTLEIIHKKPVVLTSQKKPAAFTIYIFAELINSCKVAGSSPNLLCQQNWQVNAQISQSSLELYHFFKNCNRGWAILLN